MIPISSYLPLGISWNGYGLSAWQPSAEVFSEHLSNPKLLAPPSFNKELLVKAPPPLDHLVACNSYAEGSGQSQFPSLLAEHPVVSDASFFASEPHELCSYFFFQSSCMLSCSLQGLFLLASLWVSALPLFVMKRSGIMVVKWCSCFVLFSFHCH